MILLVKGMFFFSVMGAYTSSVWKLIDDYFNSEYRSYVAEELAKSQNLKLAEEATKMLTAKSEPEKREDILAQKQEELDAKIAWLEKELTLIQNIKTRSATNEPMSEQPLAKDERPAINNNPNEIEKEKENFHNDGKLQIGLNEMKNDAITSKEKINYKNKNQQQQLSCQEEEQCQQQAKNKDDNDDGKSSSLLLSQTRTPKSKFIGNLNPYQDDDAVDDVAAVRRGDRIAAFDEIYETEDNLVAYWKNKHQQDVAEVHDQEYCVSSDFLEAPVDCGGT
jgi:hypothetical protein